MAEMRCVVVTPETTVVDVTATFIALPLFDGEMGIAPNHSPMIGRMGHGEMRVKGAKGEQSYYVDGGFVQVADNVVSVLTNRAVMADKLSESEAKALLERANGMVAKNPEMMALRDRMAAQARGQMRMLEKSK